MTFLGRSNFFKSCLPVLIGIVMGVALNMTIAPFLDELCDPVSTEDAANLIQLRETKMVHELNDQQDLKDKLDKDQKGKNDVNEAEESDGNDFYLPEHKYMQEENGGKKFVRPRFASTELGIREKLFVGVLSTPQTVNSFGMALNKTFAHYVTKTQFFTNGKSGFPPPGMHVVSFPDNDNKKLPIHVLKYLKEHYANTFDYYLFITDRTYIRGEKLFELVSHISISEEVHMGALLQKGEKDSCTLDGGILLSQSVLSKMFMQIDSCLMIDEANPSAVFESCITNITQRPCSEKGGDKIYKSYKVEDFDFDDDIDSLRNDVTFNGSYAVYPMPDDTSLYKVHRYFCQLELNLTRQEIQKAKDSIINLSEFAPGGRDSLKWPIGIPEANKPSTRFDIIQWTYFTDSHIYFDDDFTNERPLQGANKQDIQEILEVAFERLNANYENKFKQYKLVNGYRRFEPSRGMEYTLDMEVISKNRQDVTQIKRVHLLRPLGKVEILPMPYVTENSQIHLILPLYENEVNDFVNFMEGFAKTVLETSDNSYLFVVFVHQMNQSGKGNGDPFSVPKRLIDYHLNNHPSRKGTITWKVLESDDKGRSEIAVMDHVVRDLQPSDLVSVCSVGMEMDIDYLNRVRMNTVPSVQVFFPISYWQYKQNLVYEQYPYPLGIELGQKYGHFDVESYEQSSFYMSDYTSSRKHVSSMDAKKMSLIDIFIKNQNLHIFRAAEPSLRIRWRMIDNCQTRSFDDQARCEKRKWESLASRSQLAKAVFDYAEQKHKSVDSVIKSAMKQSHIRN